MLSKEMPSPYAEDCPKFHYDKPEELNRFIQQLELLFEKFGVEVDTDKINYLCAYADARTEQEWEGMASHTAGNFANFKKEIIESYPEASNLVQGSLKELKRIMDNCSQITSGDLNQLQAYRRAFSAEAKKLQRDPPLLSNHEIVHCFLEPLTESFRTRILDKLDLVRMIKSVPDSVRRPEDRFTLDEIMETAIAIARSLHTSYSSIDDVSLEIELNKNVRSLKRSEGRWFNGDFYQTSLDEKYHEK